MDAGRELDAMVAEALGYTVKWLKLGSGFAVPIWTDGDKRDHVRHYSTSYDAMGTLIEEMRGRGWRLKLEANGVGQMCCAKFVIPGNSGDYEYAETAPHAVALAARAALKGES